MPTTATEDEYGVRHQGCDEDNEADHLDPTRHAGRCSARPRRSGRTWNCGPRFTIIESLPYDRPATTMAGFPMCALCAVEYRDPADRRFRGGR